MIAATAQKPHTKITITAVTISVTALFGIAFGATSAWAASPAASASPEAYLRVLSEPPTAEDQLPAEAKGVPYAEGAGLLYDTSRYLGTDGNAEYWVVEHEKDRICLVNVLTTTGDSSMVCVTEDQFRSSGVSGAVTSLGVADEEKGYAEGYLVPDSLHFVDVPRGLTAISGNLVAGDSRDQKGTLTSTTGNGKAQLQIQLIHPDRTS